MYVVAGVSGKTGAVVADALLRAHKRVTVVVRDVAKGAPWRARGAEVAVASLDDPQALARALAGATGAYLLSPQDMRSADPISDGWRMADAIARAVEGSALPHLVLLSALGAQHAARGRQALSRTLRAAEERLAQASAKITFLRAAYFLENWASVLGAVAEGKLPTFIRPDCVVPMVSVGDIGAVAARALIEGPPAEQARGRRARRPARLQPARPRGGAERPAGAAGSTRARSAGGAGPDLHRVRRDGGLRRAGSPRFTRRSRTGSWSLTVRAPGCCAAPWAPRWSSGRCWRWGNHHERRAAARNTVGRLGASTNALSAIESSARS